MFSTLSPRPSGHELPETRMPLRAQELFPSIVSVYATTTRKLSFRYEPVPGARVSRHAWREAHHGIRRSRRGRALSRHARHARRHAHRSSAAARRAMIYARNLETCQFRRAIPAKSPAFNRASGWHGTSLHQQAIESRARAQERPKGRHRREGAFTGDTFIEYILSQAC